MLSRPINFFNGMNKLVRDWGRLTAMRMPLDPRLLIFRLEFEETIPFFVGV